MQVSAYLLPELVVGTFSNGINSYVGKEECSWG